MSSEGSHCSHLEEDLRKRSDLEAIVHCRGGVVRTKIRDQS